MDIVTKVFFFRLYKTRLGFFTLDLDIVSQHQLVTAQYLVVCTWKHEHVQVDVAQYCWYNLLMPLNTVLDG